MKPPRRHVFAVAFVGGLGLIPVALVLSSGREHLKQPEQSAVTVDASTRQGSLAPVLPADNDHSGPRPEGLGFVVDATRNPVAGATIQNVTANIRVTSDSAGQFRIALTDGINTLVARKGRLVGDAFVSSGDAPVTVSMSNGHDVVVDVVDCETKRAVANALIDAMDQQLTTDANGSATIRSLPSTSQLVTLRAEGYEPVRTGLFRNHEGDEPGHIILELCRGDRAHGRVIDQSGQPIAGAFVTVTTSRLKTHSTATTNDAGSWELAAVAPGVHVVEVMAPGFVKEKQSIVPTGSSIVLKRIGELSGVVRAESGAAVANAKIFRDRGAPGVSDAEGRFKIGGSPNTALWVEADNLGSEVLSPFTDDRAPIIVTVFPTALSIKVIDAAHQPVHGATVFVTSKQGRTFEVVTDDAGNAVLRGLPVSQYRVVAESDGKNAYGVVTLTRERASMDVMLEVN